MTGALCLGMGGVVWVGISRGKKGGRPSGLSPEKLQLAMTALDLHDTGKYSILEISKRLQIPIATCYRYIKIVKESKV
ncbi:hypothetical protein ASE74_24130 [Pedobacter sp. Leaf216]|nr:hypothetical protein ASE74_24130 [Pedobacter sp. Leaf216]